MDGLEANARRDRERGAARAGIRRELGDAPRMRRSTIESSAVRPHRPRLTPITDLIRHAPLFVRRHRRAPGRTVMRLGSSVIRKSRHAWSGSLTALPLVLLLSAVGPPPARSAPPIFSAPFLSFPTSGLPLSVAIGDLNGDGKRDLVVAPAVSLSEAASAVEVLLGDGTGMFGPSASVVIGNYYTNDTFISPLVLADLNGDAKLDLVVGCRGLTVMLGNGDGTFGTRRDFDSGASPTSIAVADLNGDGKLDVVMTGLRPNTASALMGNGDGTFESGIDYGTGTAPSSVAIGEFNGDAWPDLAVVNSGSNSVSILLGIGNGGFGATNDILMGASPHSVTIGDVNGDAKPDLAVTIPVTYEASPGAVSVLLGIGDGTFGPGNDNAVSGYPESVALVDLNNDGKLDLVTTGASVLLGNGDGTFGPARKFHAGSGNFVAVEDLNRDGKADVAGFGVGEWTLRPVTYSVYGSVSVLLGNGDGTFGATSEVDAGSGSVALVDLNGDLKLDMVVGHYGSGSVSVLLGLGNGTFGSRTDFATGSGPGQIAIEDLNRDGRLDLAIARSAANSVAVLLGTGDGGFGAPTDFAAGSGLRGVAIGDVNRDGIPDMAVANYSSRSVGVLLGAGDGTFGPMSVLTTYGYFQPSFVAIGDLNRDGKADLLACATEYYFITSEPLSSSLVWLGNGDGTFGVMQVLNFPGTIVTSMATGDFDGDGTPDVAFAEKAPNLFTCDISCTAHGGVGVLLGSGNGGLRSFVHYETGYSAVAVTIGDLNGDGRPDLAVTNSTNRAVTALLGNGDGAFEVMGNYGVGSSVGSVAVGDLNGDARSDLAVSKPDSNRVAILFNVRSDWPTPTLLSLFQGDWTDAGVELRWQFGEPGRFTSVEIQRGESAEGPWTTVSGERRDEGETVFLLDRNAPADRTSYYRLLATRTDGGTLTFGPLEVTAGASVSEFGLLAVRPNPGRDRVGIEFAVARAARVRLSVLDVQGRQVAVLADGVHTPGRYQATWEGAGAGGRVAAGLYFVRYEVAGRQWVRRFALVR